jgi:16S rRNA (cytosine967-C5)-methyltransferase
MRKPGRLCHVKPIAPARRAAFELLLELRRKPESHSDVLLRSKRVEALSALDKNLMTTLVMGVLRWQLVCSSVSVKRLPRARVTWPTRCRLRWSWERCSFCCSIASRRTPRSSKAWNLSRQSGNTYAVGLVNAVLRKLAQAPKLDAADASAAHPSWMVERWVAAYGLEAASAICRYDQLPPPTTIRLTSPEAEAAL